MSSSQSDERDSQCIKSAIRVSNLSLLDNLYRSTTHQPICSLLTNIQSGCAPNYINFLIRNVYYPLFLIYSTVPEVIDAFSHIFPKSFLEGMSDLHPTAELEEMANATQLIDVDHRLNHMEMYGVDQQIITLVRPTIWEGSNRDVASEAIQLANDTINEIGNEHPDTFIPAGTLLLLDPEYVDELERCVEDLGMPGVQIFSNIEGKPLGAEEFRPFWEAAIGWTLRCGSTRNSMTGTTGSTNTWIISCSAGHLIRQLRWFDWSGAALWTSTTSISLLITWVEWYRSIRNESENSTRSE